MGRVFSAHERISCRRCRFRDNSQRSPAGGRSSHRNVSLMRTVRVRQCQSGALGQSFQKIGKNSNCQFLAKISSGLVIGALSSVHQKIVKITT